MPLRVAALRCLGVQNRWLAKPPSWLPRRAMWGLPAIVDATQLRASVRGTGISDLGRSCSDEPSGGPASATTVTMCMSACDAAGPVSSQAARDWQKMRFASPRSIPVRNAAHGYALCYNQVASRRIEWPASPLLQGALCGRVYGDKPGMRLRRRAGPVPQGPPFVLAIRP